MKIIKVNTIFYFRTYSWFFFLDFYLKLLFNWLLIILSIYYFKDLFLKDIVKSTKFVCLTGIEGNNFKV